MKLILKETAQLTEFAGHPKLAINLPEHCAHWKVGDNGHASVDFVLYRKPGDPPVLSIDTTEWTEGAKSSKRTMVTINEESTRALYDLLRTRYESLK